MASMPTTMVSVRAGSGGRGGVRMGMGSVNTLTLEDAAAIARDCPSVVRMSPQTQTSAQAVHGTGNWSTQIEGVTEAYLDIRNIKVAEGEALDFADGRAGAKVCRSARPSCASSSAPASTPSARRSA
jgi:putative ABC transport system permease protein